MIRLVYRSHSIHELLLHQVCVDLGLYASAGLEVALVDGTGPSWKVESVTDAAATVAVGGVVAEWLRGDAGWRIDLVATVRPLMWVVGTSAVTSVDDLVGLRVATPRLADMPTLFLRLLLGRHGYALGKDVQAVECDHRPDRQRLLQEGAVDAALLGPEGLPADAAAGPGVLYVGDHVEYPTVGLASRKGLDAAEASALADAFRSGVARMLADPAVGVAAMRALDPQVAVPSAERVLRDVIAVHWRPPAWSTTDGLGDVPAVAAALGVPMPTPDAVRRFFQP